jgi:asparagine synthase (glutamine-hydrolysing)
MCGIAGLIDFSGRPVDRTTIEIMTSALSHRGPDAEGHWVEGNVGIGHRRLSVIDLTAAADQPMVSSDGRYVLTYNGEVYNYLGLRRELENEGCRFRTNSDSEVVLQALIRWGSNAVLKFNGMFALAMWDRHTGLLFLARDRYGIKPLYTAQQGNRFMFASEQKAVLAISDFRRVIDRESLFEYFCFQNIFSNRTFLRDIEMFPAGHHAVLDTRETTPVLRSEQYWDYNFDDSLAGTPVRDLETELSRLFETAVHRQLVADVPIGSYLSGGIDSGGIAAVASKHHPNLPTFTCGFDLTEAAGVELAFDERTEAAELASRLGTQHHELLLHAGDMEACLPEVAWHLEEPRVGQSYPNYLIAGLARQHVKVVLTGTGGDEIFGGYPWRYHRGSGPTSLDQFIDGYYASWQRLVPEAALGSFFDPIADDVRHLSPRSLLASIFPPTSRPLETQADFVNWCLYFEARTFLHGLLVVEDKLGMAHGLEVRVPFLDNDLVDFAMRCPASSKIRDLDRRLPMDENQTGPKQRLYFQRTNEGKHLLRNALNNRLGESVAYRRKQGFSSPDASWFKGASLNFVERRLLNNDSPIYQYLDATTCRHLVNDHLQGRQNRRLLIWSLLNFNEWLHAIDPQA